MNSTNSYPPGTVRALLDTDTVTPATRRVLQARMETPAEPRFFQPDEWVLLRSIRERLIPQPDRTEPIEPEWEVDQRLWEGKTNGWRYDEFPTDGEAYRHALRAIEASVWSRYGGNWAQLTDSERDELLRNVQRGEVPHRSWGRVQPKRFFEELLAELIEVYYAHPLAQEEIGYVGMADVPGWRRIGLNEREPREPQAEKA